MERDRLERVQEPAGDWVRVVLAGGGARGRREEGRGKEKRYQQGELKIMTIPPSVSVFALNVGK